jgi:hypothetical protein
VAKPRKRAKTLAEIDWDVVYYGKRKDKPMLTFSPGRRRRERWIEILTMNLNGSAAKKLGYTGRHRTRLLEILGHTFSVIYTRYRRQIQPKYKSPFGTERPACQRAASLCVTNSVTPFQLIKYWHDRLDNFKGMKYPSVAFLAQASRVDQVASNIVDGKLRPPKKVRPVKDANHAYSDTNRLDGDLRSRLTSAGFDLRDWNDRYLISVQSISEDVLAGNSDVFIPAKIREMVDWIVKRARSGRDS